MPQLNKIAPIPEAYMVDTDETPQNIERGHDALNQQQKETSKWKIPLISCTTQI